MRWKVGCLNRCRENEVESWLPHHLCLLPVWILRIDLLASSGHCGGVSISHEVYLWCAYTNLLDALEHHHFVFFKKSLLLSSLSLLSIPSQHCGTDCDPNTKPFGYKDHASYIGSKTMQFCHSTPTYQPRPSTYISLLHPETGKLGDNVPRPQFWRSIRVWLCSW